MVRDSPDKNLAYALYLNAVTGNHVRPTARGAARDRAMDVVLPESLANLLLAHILENKSHSRSAGEVVGELIAEGVRELRRRPTRDQLRLALSRAGDPHASHDAQKLLAMLGARNFVYDEEIQEHQRESLLQMASKGFLVRSAGTIHLTDGCRRSFDAWRINYRNAFLFTPHKPDERLHIRTAKARAIGARALQISLGAPVLVDASPIVHNPVELALFEYREGALPITLAKKNLLPARSETRKAARSEEK